jgi:hypothetical protein
MVALLHHKKEQKGPLNRFPSRSQSSKGEIENWVFCYWLIRRGCLTLPPINRGIFGSKMNVTKLIRGFVDVKPG